MFNRSDFPDFMTEAAYIRERHGPPPMSPEEVAAREKQRRKTEEEIVAAYDRGESVAEIGRSFSSPSLSLSQIRRVIAKVNHSRRFPNQGDEAQFLGSLGSIMCRQCFDFYITEKFRSWIAGKRLTFPEPPSCQHRTA